MLSRTLFVSLLASGATKAATTYDGSRFLWFNQPARPHFFEDAMPIGNGRIGATVYGGGSEVVGINENSIWTGPFQDRIAADPLTALATTRSMLLAGNMSEARQYSMANLIPKTVSPRAFSYFGNMTIDFGHADASMTNYVRWLDTKQGTTGVSYTYGGVDYSSVALMTLSSLAVLADPLHLSREYAASFPDGVLVASFNASKAAALTMKVSLNREGTITTTATAASSTYAVSLVGSSGQDSEDGPIRWTGQARFALTGGALSAR